MKSVTDRSRRDKLADSTVAYSRLIVGEVGRGEIDRAFGEHGCGALLVALDTKPLQDIYSQFYSQDWSIRNGWSEPDLSYKDVEEKVVMLLCECAILSARARAGVRNPLPSNLSRDIAAAVTCSCDLSLKSTIGRPLYSSRKEFHLSVNTLLEKEKTGSLMQHQEGTDYSKTVRTLSRMVDGKRQDFIRSCEPDEVRLLEIYREWQSSDEERKAGFGDKDNGDIYYGAYRGRWHKDKGGSMTVLLGPGEILDANGQPVLAPVGGVLEVLSPDAPNPETNPGRVALPVRLGDSEDECSSKSMPYVVLFFP